MQLHEVGKVLGSHTPTHTQRQRDGEIELWRDRETKRLEEMGDRQTNIHKL